MKPLGPKIIFLCRFAAYGIRIWQIRMLKPMDPFVAIRWTHGFVCRGCFNGFHGKSKGWHHERIRWWASMVEQWWMWLMWLEVYWCLHIFYGLRAEIFWRTSFGTVTDLSGKASVGWGCLSIPYSIHPAAWGIDATFWIFLKLPSKTTVMERLRFEGFFPGWWTKNPHWNWILQGVFFLKIKQRSWSCRDI